MQKCLAFLLGAKTKRSNAPSNACRCRSLDVTRYLSCQALARAPRLSCSGWLLRIEEASCAPISLAPIEPTTSPARHIHDMLGSRWNHRLWWRFFLACTCSRHRSWGTLRSVSLRCRNLRCTCCRHRSWRTLRRTNLRGAGRAAHPTARPHGCLRARPAGPEPPPRHVYPGGRAAQSSAVPNVWPRHV